MITDVELNRVVNALSTTLSDQRWDSLDIERAQRVVDGTLAGERKLTVRAGGELTGEDGHVLATVRRAQGGWVAERTVKSRGSDWAVPKPPFAESGGDEGPVKKALGKLTGG